MNAFEPSQPLIEAIGWALLHFVWQGALVAALLSGVLSLLRGRKANLRYLAACGGMALMLALPIATTAWTFKTAAEVAASSSTLSLGPASAFASNAEQPVRGDRWTFRWLRVAISGLDGILPGLVLLWLLGVALCSLRLAGGWIRVQRLVRCEARPVSREWQSTLLDLALKLRVTRPVRLIESALVQVPTAIGWLRPVILFPASALAGLTPNQLEAILAHELAHIRRHDYLINLAQRLIETLLFYHPAVWWVSRQARIERELCCDDLAVAVCGDAFVYARALAEMEGLRAAPQLAVAASGGLLVTRIRRLVGPAESDGGYGSLSACGVVLATVLTAIALISGRPTAHSAASQPPGQVEGALKLSTPPQPAVEAHPASPARIASEPSGTTEKAGAIPQRLQESSSPLLGGQDVEALLAALNDEDFHVRDKAIAELGKLGERRAVEPLISLLKDPNVYIRDNAINSLGLIGDRRAVEPLLEALDDQNVYIRDNAITALGRLRDPRAVEPLISLLSDRNVYLRDNAASALGEIGDPRALEPLRTAANDENWYVRQSATKSLARLSGN